MGRGNVKVDGDFEGLYYIDRGYLDYYNKKGSNEESVLFKEISYSEIDNYSYDSFMSEINYSDFITNFISDFTLKYSSFTSTENEHGIILENELFNIEIENNEWSYAVKLIQKEQEYYQRGNIKNLQKRHFLSYLEGIKNCLFNQFDEIGTYGGAWTSGIIKKVS